MKKLALLFVMVASLSLISCGGRNAKKATAEAAQTEETIEVTEETNGDAVCENEGADKEGCCEQKAEGETTEAEVTSAEAEK